MIVAFLSEHFDISLDNRPDDTIIDCRILVSQLVAEVDNSASMADGTEDLIG